jgi:hypothetical protein
MAALQGGPAGTPETDRVFYLAYSDDDGQTFSRRNVSARRQRGDCCALQAYLDHTGILYVLYRAASNTCSLR